MSLIFKSKELLNLKEELSCATEILYINKEGNEGLVPSLKSLSLHTGWAMYIWESGVGLMNLKSSEPPSPRTKKLNDALKFAIDRKHFAVFIFPVNTKDAWLEAKLYFSKVTKFELKESKYLFILPMNDNCKFFESECKLVKFKIGLNGSMILRDGNWVSTHDVN